MTVDQLTVDMAGTACFAANGLLRSGEPITEVAYLFPAANLRKTIAAAADVRGILHPLTFSFLHRGVTIHFGMRPADLTGRIAK